jgi:hypothetical protein
MGVLRLGLPSGLNRRRFESSASATDSAGDKCRECDKVGFPRYNSTEMTDWMSTNA